MRAPEWVVRESAVLAIGAVADGCSSFMAPHLPALVSFLLTQLHDKQPLIRSITCWTLGRYSAWIVEQPVCIQYAIVTDLDVFLGPRPVAAARDQ